MDCARWNAAITVVQGDAGAPWERIVVAAVRFA